MMLSPVAERFSQTAVKTLKSGDDAKALAKRLEAEGFTSRQIDIVAPDDEFLGKKMDPEQRDIARTGVRAHLIFGLLGIAGALVVSLLMIGYGPAFAQFNPYWTLLALSIVGAFFGLLVGGFVTLRMDKDFNLMKVLGAQQNHEWSVIVHAEDRYQKAQAKKSLNG